jgi:hypothetical protein
MKKDAKYSYEERVMRYIKQLDLEERNHEIQTKKSGFLKII